MGEENIEEDENRGNGGDDDDNDLNPGNDGSDLVQSEWYLPSFLCKLLISWYFPYVS